MTSLCQLSHEPLTSQDRSRTVLRPRATPPRGFLNQLLRRAGQTPAPAGVATLRELAAEDPLELGQLGLDAGADALA